MNNFIKKIKMNYFHNVSTYVKKTSKRPYGECAIVMAGLAMLLFTSSVSTDSVYIESSNVDTAKKVTITSNADTALAFFENPVMSEEVQEKKRKDFQKIFPALNMINGEEKTKESSLMLVNAEEQIKEERSKDDDLCYVVSVDVCVVSENQVSENQVSENQVSENQVSENQVSENQVSENQVSENQVSENQVSEDQVSEDQVSEREESTSDNELSEEPVGLENEVSANELTGIMEDNSLESVSENEMIVDTVETTTVEETTTDELPQEELKEEVSVPASEPIVENPVEEVAASETGISASDYDVLCRIVEAEAGCEGEEGKLLVADVVLNRVANPSFPNSVTEVVMDGGQFSPVRNGRFQNAIVTPETMNAVNRALAGENIAMGALYFKSVNSHADWGSKTLLFQYGNHNFYN